MNTWYEALTTVKSRGELAERPGSLAGLHARRREHFGQFFTPPELVRFLWTIVEDVDAQIHRRSSGLDKIAIYDNACGVGNMFWLADPARHVLYGVDIDGDAIAALSHAAMAAGFEATFRNAGMEDVTTAKADVAIINPPFGLQLSSPFLEYAEGITTYGKHGPNTAALSQSYAIHQALQSCPVVIAVVPHSYLPTLSEIHSIHRACEAIIELPPGLFRGQGTDVRVAVVVLNENHWLGPTRYQVNDLAAAVEGYRPRVQSYGQRRQPPRIGRVKDTEPTITKPLTGDRRVFVSFSGRKIHLRCLDGLTEAKVLNAVHRERVVVDPEAPRMANGTVTTGQGWLDLETLLHGPDARHNLDRLVRTISSAGGIPVVDAGLQNHYRKRLRTDALRRAPLRRWAFVGGAPDLGAVEDGTEFQAEALTDHLIDPLDWCSSVVKAGDRLSVKPVASDEGRQYEVSRGNRVLYTRTYEALVKDYAPQLPDAEGWRLIAPGRRAMFPQLAASRLRQAVSAGLDLVLHWDHASNESCYQLDDVIELTMAPRGVLAWSMGLGKSRAAVAACMLGGKHNLIVCESYLIDEIVEEIGKLGIPGDQWQVLRTPSQLVSLRKVNVISYARLRSPLHMSSRAAAAAVPPAPACAPLAFASLLDEQDIAEATAAIAAATAKEQAASVARPARVTSGRRTWARALRRRLHTVVADEADILANRYTDQSQALWMLSPKRRYGMTGTPVPNYCRNALPLLIWAGGDGTSYQPYGDFQPFIAPQNLSSMQYSRRGMDVFRERHVTLEWAVREFTEDLTRGAKREVPRLRNVEAFREMLAPHLLRRVPGEPEIARWIKLPEPTRFVHNVEWDAEHLRRYLITAWDFASWFRARMQEEKEAGRAVSLITLLAQINQVCKAANIPHELDGPAEAYTPYTSKQRAAADLLAQWTEQGRKSVLFATNPAAIKRIAKLLKARGIRSVIYTGGVSVAKRNRELKENFKQGNVSVALISLGSGQRGLNIPQASRVLFYNRSWTPRTEDQAGRRVIRPQQKLDVEFHFLHLLGSIDDYQCQMVEQKGEAIGAGVDYTEQGLVEGDFLHLTTILGRFCDDLKLKYSVEHQRDLLEVLSDAA